MTEKSGVERSTATEILRRLLDEHGVEHKDFFDQTWWEDSDGAAYTAVETRPLYNNPLYNNNPSTKLMLKRTATPEQAIAATLGAGTCHTVAMDCFGNPPYNTSGLNGNSTACGCSECGAPWSTMGIFRGNQLKHNFKACPICGRRIVDPTTNDVDAEEDA